MYNDIFKGYLQGDKGVSSFLSASRQVPDEYIQQVCSTSYSAVFVTLGVITSNLRVNSREATEKHYQDLENAIIALADLWKAANLGHTPKLHSLLTHAFLQMKFFGALEIF